MPGRLDDGVSCGETPIPSFSSTISVCCTAAVGGTVGRYGEAAGARGHPNVRVKISGACTLSREAFPYDDIWISVPRIIDAFGIDRCMGDG